MKVKSDIAKEIDSAGINAKYDAAVKRLLSEKQILAWILKSCVEEFSSCNVRDIAEKYITGEPQVGEVPVMQDESAGSKVPGTGVEDVTITEGTVTYDVRFAAQVPGAESRISLIINVEAQDNFYPGYPPVKRGIYYCSRMISAQHGTVFSHSHYEKLQKVYSIWIFTNPPAGRKDTVTRYSLQEESCVGIVQENRRDYDLLSLVMICLGGHGNNGEGGILKLLDVLLSSEIRAEEKKEILEREYEIPMTETLERRVNEMCNLSKGVEEKGISQGLKWGLEKGLAQGIEEGLAQGIEKGLAQGIEKGLAQGIEKGELKSIRNLADSMKCSLEQAMEALKIPEEKRAYYGELLRK